MHEMHGRELRPQKPAHPAGFVVSDVRRLGSEALMPQQPSPREVLERCASDLHGLAFDVDEVAWSPAEEARRVHEVERLFAEARAVVRGRG